MERTGSEWLLPKIKPGSWKSNYLFYFIADENYEYRNKIKGHTENPTSIFFISEQQNQIRCCFYWNNRILLLEREERKATAEKEEKKTGENRALLFLLE